MRERERERTRERERKRERREKGEERRLSERAREELLERVSVGRRSEFEKDLVEERRVW